jgi:hypothetical protein
MDKTGDHDGAHIGYLHPDQQSFLSHSPTIADNHFMAP